MNYDTLFPKLLKQIPNIKENDMCYHYQKNNNDNRKLHIFCPQGKKMILWFLTFNKNKYSILLEYDSYKKKFQKCYFQYLSFKPELTNGCGTLIYCTKVKNEVCLQKIVYLMGKKYEKKNISEHMFQMKYILENYIHPIYQPHFICLKLPIMTNYNNLILQASNLPYSVYSIMKLNHYQIFIREFCTDFTIIPIDIKKNIYELWCYKNEKLFHYSNAFVNDYKTSSWLKELFIKNPISYLNIEYSDDEEDESFSTTKENIQCIYIPKLNKWKPYKKSKNRTSSFSKIKFIENKKYDIIL